MLLMSSTLSAQNISISTIEWNSSSTLSVIPGDVSNEPTKIVSSPTQVVWYDNSGGVLNTFTVTDIEGTWANISNNGSILFKINSGNFSGIVQFMKADGERTIRIHLVMDDESPVYELTVSDINTL